MKHYLLILMALLVLVLSGCETMKGLGSDIETAGKAIKKKANEY